MGQILETSLKPTAYKLLLLCEVARWFLASHFCWAQCVSSMRKMALQSTGDDEVTLRAQTVRIVLVKSVGSKWCNTPLWLRPPGEEMMMSQFSFCDTWWYWCVIGQVAVGHGLQFKSWTDKTEWVCEESELKQCLGCSFLLKHSAL